MLAQFPDAVNAAWNDTVLDSTAGALIASIPALGKGPYGRRVASRVSENSALPPRYIRNADGSITGPAGGRAWETGYVNELGQQVFQRASGGYYVVGESGAQIRVRSPKVHGNTLDNTPTEIYRLVTPDSGYLKTGISKDALLRYSRNELGLNDIQIIGTRTRIQAAAIERFIVERWPGPLNLESWAGARNPNHPNFDPNYIPAHLRGN